MRRLAIFLAVLASCDASENLLRAPPKSPFDVVIVPGCPSENSGALSHCQLARAAHAALVWKKGWTKYVIASGTAAHSPYIEAEALAEAMSALGVPADRIFLEPQARHTDENMYFSWRLARALGFSSVAVASNGSQAKWGCRMLTGWGQSCTAIAMHVKEVTAFLNANKAALQSVHPWRVPQWVPVEIQEAELAEETGYERPPSFLLYPLLGLLNINHATWIPRPPDDMPIITWAERRKELQKE